MITREQVADLRAGDVVGLTGDGWGGASARGPLVQDYSGRLVLPLGVGVQFLIRMAGGAVSESASRRTLTVISRAPRPFYVNHTRENPVFGDVVRDADNLLSTLTWRFDADGVYAWHESGLDGGWQKRSDLPDRLRLLVDGNTGMVVQQ